MIDPQHKPKTIEEIEETPFVNVRTSLAKDKPKLGPPTWQENLSSYFSQYCGATSVHGVQYVGERGRYLFEKLIWTGIITIVCYFCVILVLKTYNKWVTSPVIVTISTTETLIAEIPFPAVTICPDVKSDPSQFNYTDALIRKFAKIKLDESEEVDYQALSLICNGVNNFFDGYGDFDSGNRTVDETIISRLIQIVPDPTKHNISSATWLNYRMDLNESLTISLTSAGVCYSFNMLDYTDIMFELDELLGIVSSTRGKKTKKWTMDDGYPEGETLDAFPRRTFLPGISGGLTLTWMTNHSHIDYLCGDSLQGFKVTLHHPSELPNMDRHFRLPLDEAVLVAIKPRMLTISPELASYNPTDRKCFYSYERQLSLFKIYTQQNCLDECYTNFTLEQCGCVPFYMPKHTDSLICGPGSYKCTEVCKVHYLLKDGDKCNCLPPCTSIEYDVEISQTDWNWKGMFNVLRNLYANLKNETFDYDEIHVSMLQVYYKDMEFLANERNELYGSTDFFSNIGGLFGLFIGFSVTSVIEILYFLTLRLGCNILKYGKVVWSGDEELMNRLN